MSILLSDEKILKILADYSKAWYALSEEEQDKISPHLGEKQALAKAAAIHAVQWMEAPCDKHREHDIDVCRFMCPDCMKQIHEELGI